MPLYDYQCTKCRKITEVRHGFDEKHDAPCPACGGSLTRLFNPAGIVFKGSGFYVTDSRKSSGGEKPATSSETSSEKPAGSAETSGEKAPSGEKSSGESAA
ncbi:MAG: hypothetical protein JOZ38_05955 [Candidatus Eremiobacteraeota bacterium]|nr:hypothetical protein [Candidatus Eremiobacteraeota bacterium]